MKQRFILAFCCGVLACGWCFTAPAAEPNEEQQLISVLNSDRSPREKDAACARLKRIGTAQAVPALAALLTDPQLSHSARYALESMPTREAGQALLAALDKTDGLTKVGLINSLGIRRENQAMGVLTTLLADADANVSGASAWALGKIGGLRALLALEQALNGAPATAHEAFIDAILMCGHGLMASGSRTQAFSAFQKLYATEKKDAIRLAAYRGMIQSADNQALKLLTTGIASGDGPSQAAALQWVPEIPGSTATKALLELLPKLNVATRCALLEGLGQRADVAAAPAIALEVRSPDAAVRLAALKALGLVGDASHVSMLIELAATAPAEEQKAARESLRRLRHGNVADALLQPLTSAPEAVQVELVTALGDRRETAAIPKLLDLARSGPDTAQKAALRALALLAEAPQIGSLVKLVVEAKYEALMAEACAALDAMCLRVQAKQGKLDVTPLVNALATSRKEARLALLPVCGGLVDPRIRDALRAAAKDEDASVRIATLRALSATRDVELLSDLLKVAREATDESFRIFAIRGGVRLTTEEEGATLSQTKRLETLKALLGFSHRPEEKRLVLAGLARIPDPTTLPLVLPLLDDPAVQAEAAQTVTRIASDLAGAQAELASNALKKVVAVTPDGAIHQAAATALNQIDAMRDFITAWQVAGPYRQAGQNFTALFDIVFLPETDQASKARWTLIPAGAEPKRPWVMDLLKFFGGEQCVAYARTRIFSESDQTARLELGSDDGVKAWLNGKLIHSHNTSRALTAGSDKAEVNLQKGWNTLLLKITQNNQGWAFCARLVKPDGSRLTGLRYDLAFGEP